MTEKLLQYIWQFQYFNRSDLQSVNGESVEVVIPGTLNNGQGPDFVNAQIKIDGTLFAGSVEIHLKTSNWADHRHDSDANYRNVILHVVYEHNGGTPGLPVVELRSRISRMLLERYSMMMNTPGFIPCSHSITKADELLWNAWKERLLAERLTRRTATVMVLMEQNQYHWEETFWWLLARNFGMKTNGDAFEAIARTLPLSLLSRHKHQVIQMEALLMGQAGLLGRTHKEAYPKLLWREYQFLKKKYSLTPVFLPIHFLRMRPGNFPTLRLAQLAATLAGTVHLFSKILESKTVPEVKGLFAVGANDYWHYHYRLDEPSPFKQKNVGVDMIRHTIINTVVPVLFAYGLYHKDEYQKQKAVNWMHQLSGEVNTITKGFSRLHVPTKTAFDTQALLELKSQYCDQRHCLRCAVGNRLLKEESL